MPEFPEQLDQSVRAAFAFFGLFRQPLTLLEAARLRYVAPGQRPSGAASVADVRASVARLGLRERDGQYWLADGEAADPVELRHRRFRRADAQYRRILTFAKWARVLPTVRLVAVCNSLAMVGADEDSDIDLFVVCRPGTLWVTRLVIVGVLAALGLRPTPQVQAGRFCLSFFLAEDALDISRFALGPDDVYLTYWLATLVPVYDAGGVHGKLLAANRWLADRLPGFHPAALGPRRQIAGPASLRLPESALRALEPFAERFQRRRLPPTITSLMNRDTRVVVDRNTLKFHVNDRREGYRRRFLERAGAMEDN